MDTITIAAGSEVLNETITIHAPASSHEAIRSLAPFVLYGERYDRAVMDTLRDMSDLYRRANGDERWHTLAAVYLTWCLDRKGLTA